jgi:hypothetical protein
MTGLRWYYCLTEPCEWLAIWIGPHRHLLRDDGSLGIVVERISSAGGYVTAQAMRQE